MLGRRIGRPTRISLDRPSKLITADGVQVPVCILDISREGVRVRSEEELFQGEQARLLLGKAGYVAIEVKWVRGNEAGAVFVSRAAAKTSPRAAI